jgi:16S rRNA C1402 (ribose-2'-O) methylase RsmI
MAVFWVVAPMRALIALMMEAARTSETLVSFYQTTRRYNPKDSHLRTHRLENLKSYLLTQSLTTASDAALLHIPC